MLVYESLWANWKKKSMAFRIIKHCIFLLHFNKWNISKHISSWLYPTFYTFCVAITYFTNSKIRSYNYSNLQASGRAVYINDIAGQPGECFAEFVLSTEANAKIQSIDPSEALVNLDLFLLNVFWYIIF